MLTANQGIADPEQLATLTRALQDYCREAGIEPGTPAYDDAGRQLMFLYACGFSSAEDLVKAMLMDKRLAS